MTLVQMQKDIKVHCETCGHYRSRHEKGIGCLVCVMAIAKGFTKQKPCRNWFTSRLPQSEIEQAKAASKTLYGGKQICATCLEIWWAHDGMLCPNGETLFTLLLGS